MAGLYIIMIALQVALKAPEVVEEDVGIVSVCLNITGEPDMHIRSTAVFNISTQSGSASAGLLYFFHIILKPLFS